MSIDNETVRDVFLAAGGFAEVARKVGANHRTTVRWWAEKNLVPPRWITKASKATGKPESFFWRLHSS